MAFLYNLNFRSMRVVWVLRKNEGKEEREFFFFFFFDLVFI